MDLNFAAQAAGCVGCWIVASLGFMWLWHRARKGQGR
jgi:hypothetical protein